MLISTMEIRDKEVINLLNGRSLGYVNDIEIDLQRGRVEALIIPAQGGLRGFFGGGEEYVIKWKDIVKIGEDVILAKVADDSSIRNMQEEEENDDEIRLLPYHEKKENPSE